MAFSTALTNKKLAIYCDYCFTEITIKEFIRCVDCSLDLCLPCFLSNNEFDGHKATHCFRIVSGMEKPLFCPGWRVIDELILIHSIVQMGLCNFAGVANLLAPKTEPEISAHFYEIFGIKNDKEGEQEKVTADKSDPNDPVVLGYLPKRRDFEAEIINEYESLISMLHFTDQDSDQETQLKKYMLDHYRMVLKMRRMWKNFILDRNLIDVKRLTRLDTSSAGQFIMKYKWLVQYISKNDFNRLIGGFLKEAYLRSAYDLVRHSYEIDEARLNDVSGLLSPQEKELCKRMHMNFDLYADLKQLAIECFIQRKSLKKILPSLFSSIEATRVEAIYSWFKSQNITIDSEDVHVD